MFVAVLLLASLGSSVAAAQPSSLQNEEDTCTADDQLLSQTRLHAPQKTITSSEAGQIAGGFQVDPAAQCTVMVSITMSVPSGMSIQGASDVWSTGAGMTSAQFEVKPSGGVKDIRANVFARNTGERTVTADITYWPKENRDLSKEIDGIQLTFNVEESNQGTESNATTTGTGPVIFDQILTAISENSAVVLGIFVALLLAVIVIVGLAAARGGDQVVNVAQRNDK